MTPVERVQHYQRRITEVEKYKGPIAQALIADLKRKIDEIRAQFWKDWNASFKEGFHTGHPPVEFLELPSDRKGR